MLASDCHNVVLGAVNSTGSITPPSFAPRAPSPDLLVSDRQTSLYAVNFHCANYAAQFRTRAPLLQPNRPLTGLLLCTQSVNFHRPNYAAQFGTMGSITRFSCL